MFSIFADLALEKGSGAAAPTTYGITLLSLVEKVHSGLPVKRLGQAGRKDGGSRGLGMLVEEKKMSK